MKIKEAIKEDETLRSLNMSSSQDDQSADTNIIM